MSKILFGGAVWCLVMAIVDIFVWNTFVMEHFGTIKFMDHWETTSVVKLLYLNNAAVATRYRIGRVHSQLPNEAFVLINRTSDSSLKTLYVAYSKIFIAFTWIFFSILMMCSLGHRRRGNFMTYMWGLFTLLNFIGDLIFTIVYVNDLQYASNLNDLVQYIDGILSGAGRANPDTEIAVWIMIFIVFKGALGALINVVLTFFFFTYYRRVNRNVRAEDPPCPYIRGDNATIEMQDYSPRPSPPMHHGPRFVKRTPKQNQEFLALHHPDLYPAQEIEQPSTTSAIEQHPGAGKYSIKFPESLMSISQRIDQIIKHEHVSSPIPGLKIRKPRNPPMSPVMSISSGEEHVQIEETSPSRHKAKELNSQMPWSYIPPPVNHMRDQLPADEELPPVPVPDYIVHPSYRKASVHRAQSSLSRELRNKLTNLQKQNRSLKEKHNAGKSMRGM